MSVSGDWSGLTKLIANTSQLPKVAQRAVSAALTDTAAHLIARGFAAERSPEGERWQPNQAGTPTLHESGDLEASAEPHNTGSGFAIDSDLPYAAIQNFGGDAGRHGATHLPARPFLPGDTLPESWEEPMREAAEQALDSLLTGD
jgi:phage gpG-like protein